MGNLDVVTIKVTGRPAPQGSKRHVGGGRMIEMSKAVGPWREAVRADTVRAVNGRAPFEGPVMVQAVVYLPRPQGHHGARGLKPSAPEFPAGRPDLDKLMRSIMDGMKAGGVYRDDSQVVDLKARKAYADGPITPGATILVTGVRP